MPKKVEEEENFIERRRKWKSSLNTTMSPRLALSVLPAIVVCVFLLMSAPYLQRIIARMGQPPPKEIIRGVTTSDELPVAKAPVEIPINPELADSLFYQKLYDEQGFDWRTKPVLDIPVEEKKLEKITIEPVPVEIPLTIAPSTEAKIFGN